MKNTAINTLNYTGIVSLSQYVGKKKIKIAQMHNTGGESLFNFLANCLTGNFDSAKVSYPTKIKLIYRELLDNKNNIYEYSSASGFIFVRRVEAVETNPGECRVKYSFMIPRDLLDNITSIDTLGLGLYSHSALESEPERFIAFCAFNGLDISRNELTNATLLVDWELVIANTSAAVSQSPIRPSSSINN
jgi:hypothetical protein